MAATDTTTVSGSVATPVRPSRRRTGRRRRWLLLAPMAPGLLFLVAFSIYPTIYSLVISFYRWNLNNPLGKVWGGFHNFDILLKDKAFWHSVGVTLEYVGA